MRDVLNDIFLLKFGKNGFLFSRRGGVDFSYSGFTRLSAKHFGSLVLQECYYYSSVNSRSDRRAR